jgi:hypothetical protein
MTIPRRLLAAPLALGGALLLGACSDDDNRVFAPPDPTATDTVIGLASTTDEVAEPFPINDGALVFDDTAEDTEPAALNP